MIFEITMELRVSGWLSLDHLLLVQDNVWRAVPSLVLCTFAALLMALPSKRGASAISAKPS